MNLDNLSFNGAGRGRKKLPPPTYVLPKVVPLPQDRKSVRWPVAVPAPGPDIHKKLGTGAYGTIYGPAFPNIDNDGNKVEFPNNVTKLFHASKKQDYIDEISRQSSGEILRLMGYDRGVSSKPYKRKDKDPVDFKLAVRMPNLGVSIADATKNNAFIQELSTINFSVFLEQVYKLYWQINNLSKNSMLHGDLHSGNVMVNKSGTLTIIDFDWLSTFTTFFNQYSGFGFYQNPPESVIYHKDNATLDDKIESYIIQNRITYDIYFQYKLQTEPKLLENYMNKLKNLIQSSKENMDKQDELSYIKNKFPVFYFDSYGLSLLLLDFFLRIYPNIKTDEPVFFKILEDGCAINIKDRTRVDNILEELIVYLKDKPNIALFTGIPPDGYGVDGVEEKEEKEEKEKKEKKEKKEDEDEEEDEEEEEKNKNQNQKIESTVKNIINQHLEMNDHYVFIDHLYRSRMTILDILSSRGCDVEEYRNFSPSDASESAEKVDALNMEVQHPSGKVIHVQYHEKVLNRAKIEAILNNISDDDANNIEFIFISVSASVTDVQHKIAIEQFLRLKEDKEKSEEEEKKEKKEKEEEEEKEKEKNEIKRKDKQRRKLRISFFNMDMIVCNPLKHILVPKHEIVPEEEHAELMKSMYITSKSKFPEIKYHIDPIARCIGAVPGDIIKITRPSASCGEAIIYRVCAV